MKVLTPTQCPFTGPYSSDVTELPFAGRTVIALKRMISRGTDYLEWRGDGFTDVWKADGAFDKAFRQWQRDVGMPSHGVYGEQMWKHARAFVVPQGKHHEGEFALDEYSLDLIRQEYKEDELPDTAEKIVAIRAAITEFCLLARRNEDAWHYNRRRPFIVYVNPSGAYIVSDCSGFVVEAYAYAKKKTGLPVPDPAKQGWSGYGNTDEYEDEHPHVTNGNYRVGDLAHYNGHVTICHRAGTDTTAMFTSHGLEAGPVSASLHYRRDLRFVVRPPLLPAE